MAYTLSTGTAHAAQSQLRRAMELFESIESTALLAEAAQAVAGIHMMATAQHDAALPVSDELPPRAHTPAWRAACAWNLAEYGRQDEAARELDAIGVYGYARPGDPQTLLIGGLCVRAAFRCSSGEHAFAQRQRLEPIADRWIATHFGGQHLGPTPLFLGLLANLEGRHDDAEAHLQQALSMARSFGSMYFEAMTLAYRAETSARAGDLTSARRHFDQACKIVEGTGYEAMVDGHAGPLDQGAAL